MFKRHPHIVPLIRRVIMPLVVRTRLRRKRRSADLLITFLRDSTGMSETVRAIHAFRKTVLRVQRWMKAWIASKHCRLRVLWLKCERMYRERLRAEGADGKTSTAVAAASSRVNMFAGTVDELGAKRKQLARLLEDQENARLARLDEARYQQEIIEKKQKAEEDRIARYRKLKHLKKAEIKAQEKARSNVAKKASGGGGGGLFSPSVDSTAAASSAAVSTMSSLPGYLMQKGAVKRAQLPWHKRIRNSASNIKIYDQLEEVLKYERRRHMVNLFKVKRKGDECLVAPYELRRFLKNPNGYDGVNEISKKLSEVQVISDSKAK